MAGGNYGNRDSKGKVKVPLKAAPGKLQGEYAQNNGVVTSRKEPMHPAAKPAGAQSVKTQKTGSAAGKSLSKKPSGSIGGAKKTTGGAKGGMTTKKK